MADVLCPIVVGRVEELAKLDATLEAALGGDGAVVCLTGEAGIGKSRLARELATTARSRHAAVAVGRGVPNGATTPYRPLTEALLQCMRGRELPPDPELVPWLPALGAIVPTLAGESAGEASSPVRAEAIIQLLGRLGTPRGLVLVLEDLHWSDPDTLAVVEYLADNLVSVPVLLVITARSDEPCPAGEMIGRLVRTRSALHLPMQRLDAARVAEMVRTCVPDADDEVVARVQRTTDGIPFLVEEVLASPGVPASFGETVRARLVDFRDEERHVLSAAAIFGRQFDWQLLHDATYESPDVVLKALERGMDQHLLRVDDGVFSFRHALTREAILERLLPPRRAELAGAALEAVDAAHPGLDGPWRDLAADLAFQAGHAERAERAERAGELLIASGRSAIERGALATAVEALRRAHALGHRQAGTCSDRGTRPCRPGRRGRSRRRRAPHPPERAGGGHGDTPAAGAGGGCRGPLADGDPPPRGGDEAARQRVRRRFAGSGGRVGGGGGAGERRDGPCTAPRERGSLPYRS